MLKSENVEKYKPDVESAVCELWATANENQKNENDLLLILINGSTNNYPLETLKRIGITKFQYGPDFVQFRYNDFFAFFDQFKFVLDPDSLEEQNNNQEFLAGMIQMQLLAYMKFWEADLILKRLLNLSRLAQGLEYSWEITQDCLDKRRQLIKEHIQKPIENLCPKFYGLINDVYSSQLRNAIAHSQYYLLYDTIYLTNKAISPHYELHSITFDKWDEIFTKLILMHNCMIENFNKYHEIFRHKVEPKHNGLLIQFPEKMPNGLNRTGWLKYDVEISRWV